MVEEMFVSSFIMQTSGLKEGRKEAGWGLVWGLVLHLRTTSRELGGNNAQNKPAGVTGVESGSQ